MFNPMFTNSKRWATACLILALAFALCGGPQLAAAQQAPANPPPPPQAQTDTQAPSAQDQNQDQNNDTQQPSQSEAAAQQQQQTARPGMVDPSKGPLTPAPGGNQEQPPTMQPENLPDAPSATQTQQPAGQETPGPAPKRPRSTQPVGVGTAQQAPTAGGAASKPAGAAIAPAKQKQYRSLLIKIGAIAGAGIALGTVYALSRGTKSTPPGTGR